jgi:arylsulfatase A-like enzyme
VSVPLVAYHVWFKKTELTKPNEIRSSVTNSRDQSVPTEDILSPQNANPSLTGEKRPNIILVIFDGLTARNMSLYGYQRPTTPFISEWAKQATLFTKAKAESNYTLPTSASLMTGKRVWTHQSYYANIASKYMQESSESLPNLLKKNGYITMTFQQAHGPSVNKLGLSEYFDIALGPESFGSKTSLLRDIERLLYKIFSKKIILYDWLIRDDFIFALILNIILSDSAVTDEPPDEVFDKFLDTIDGNLPAPFFAWIHLWVPHDPYLPPKPYMGMFNSSHELTTWKKQKHANPIQKIITFKDRYDEFIRYGDEKFKDFISQLEMRNILKTSVLILSSDHGESFAHKYKGHGGPHLYEDVMHIPLIIKQPDQVKGNVITNRVEQIDIAPTILELASIPVSFSMEGRSLLPYLSGKTLQSRPAFSMSLERNMGRGKRIVNGTIAVWDGDYKLIHYLDDNKSLLFNLERDPDEMTNLFHEENEIGQYLKNLILENLASANEKIVAQ